MGYVAETVVIVRDELLIYPNYQPLDEWVFRGNAQVGQLLTTEHTLVDMTSVASAREYTPGDRLSVIDWKVTARANKLMTKEFDDYVGTSFYVVLDCASDLTIAVDAFEKSVEFAATLLMNSMQRGFSIGFVTVGEATATFPVQFSDIHQTRVFHHLAKLDQYFGNCNSQALASEIKVVSLQALLLVISTKLNGQVVERLFERARNSGKTLFCLVTNGRILTEQETNCLLKMKNMGVLTYVLDKEKFQEDMERG